MSLARIYTSKTVRKDWTCEKCKSPIRKGIDGRITFAVGFRGREHTRCTRQECFPAPSERESTLVSTVYAAQESMAGRYESFEDLEADVQTVIDACDEVADEYESNEMIDINEDLQERADTIRAAGEELADWADSLEEEPQEDDFDEDEEEQSFEEAHTAWLDEAIEAAMAAVNDMELP
jgi:FtsZ-binding cell division protein ZapB